MEFYSPRFFTFLIGTLVLSQCFRSHRGRLQFLVLASCLFYACWDWRYLPLLLIISLVDFLAAALIGSSSRPPIRAFWLFFSLAVNLGCLFAFKYSAWIFHTAALALPLGISFYTFKTISYTVDVYRGKIQRCRSWADYAMFVTFFPELVAGPIVRASVFLPQLQRPRRTTWRGLVVGGNLFLQGLTKKILVADHLAQVVDPVYAHPHWFSAPALAMATVAFYGQVYCDFSGYTDMAIGTAKMLGYDLPMNFDWPMRSTSISEFWRRWHITLGSWFRDYFYIPLRRRSGRAWSGNTLEILLMMLLVGLWHGARWNFVVWGALHGLGLVGHRLWKKRQRPLPSGLAWLLTFTFLTLSGVFFRSPSRHTACVVLGGMTGLIPTLGQNVDFHWFFLCWLLIGLAHMIRHPWAWTGLEPVDLPLSGRYLCFTKPTFASGFALCLWLGLLLFYCSLANNPFVYFQF